VKERVTCDFIPHDEIMGLLEDATEPDVREVQDIADKAREAKGLSPTRSSEASQCHAR